MPSCKISSKSAKRFLRYRDVCMYSFRSKSSQVILLTPSRLKSILSHFSSSASQFSTNKVTPRSGSVATHLRCGGISSDSKLVVSQSFYSDSEIIL